MKRILEPEVMKSKKEAEVFHKLALKIKEPVFEFFKRELRAIKKAKLKILDLGSGTAILDIHLAKSDENWKFVGVELSDEMNNVAKRSVKYEQLEDQIEIQKRDAKKTKLPNRSFNVIISNNLLHQIRDPLTVLNECARLVKSDGVVVIRDVMRPDSEEEIEKIIQERREKLGVLLAADTEKMVKDSAKAGLQFNEIKMLINKSDLKRSNIWKEIRHKGHLPHYVIRAGV